MRRASRDTGIQIRNVANNAHWHPAIRCSGNSRGKQSQLLHAIHSPISSRCKLRFLDDIQTRLYSRSSTHGAPRQSIIHVRWNEPNSRYRRTHRRRCASRICRYSRTFLRTSRCSSSHSRYRHIHNAKIRRRRTRY